MPATESLCMVLDVLLGYCESVSRQSAVYLLVTDKTCIDLASFIRLNATKMHIIGTKNSTSEISTTGNLTRTSLLSHLSIYILRFISDAVQDRSLPKLSHLRFECLGSSVKDNLALLETTFSELTHFSLNTCKLSESDILAFFNGMYSEKFPKLNSLTLTLDADLNGEITMPVTHSGLENINAKLQRGTDDVLFMFLFLFLFMF